jgi:hypothetical protein
VPTLLPTELTSSHVRAQAARFLRLAVMAIAAQVLTMGTTHLDRTTLVSAAIAVAETLYRSLAPAVPWAAIVKRLDVRPLATTTPAPVLAAVTEPAAPAAPPAPTTAPDGPKSGQ